MPLPNPGMNFTPFDTLPAADLNDIVENIEALAAGTGFTAGSIPNSALATNAQPQRLLDESLGDFVASGLVWSGDSYGATRNASMTLGVAYINGVRLSLSAVAARTFTASRDTYVDINSSGTLVYTEVTNGAASPALAASSIRIAKIVTGASNIANAAAITQYGSDTLNNKIYPGGSVNPNVVYAKYQSGTLASPALSTTPGVGLTYAIPTTTRPHAYFVLCAMELSLGGGGGAETFGRILQNGATVDQHYSNQPAGQYFYPLVLHTIVRSSGGENIVIDAARSSGSGGGIIGNRSSYSIIDMGVA